jgi:hypothetical protein
MKATISAGFDPTEMQWFDISGADLSTGIKIDNLTTHRPPFERSLVLWSGQTTNHERYEMMMLVSGRGDRAGSKQRATWEVHNFSADGLFDR